MADLILVTSLLAAALAFPLAFYLLWKPRKAPLPPGPRGLPLLGYLPFLATNLHHQFAELARTHGPVMSLRIGSKLCVVLSSPAAAKEALKDQDAVFANHDPPAAALASTYANDIVWTPHGPVWRMLRNMMVQELFCPAVIEDLHAVRRHEVLRMVEEVRRRAGRAVNVRKLSYATVMHVITTMVWGSRLEEAHGEELMEVVGDIVDLLVAPNVSDVFPAVAWLDLQGRARRMRGLWARLDRFFDPVIEERRRLRTAAEGEGGAARAAGRTRSRDFLQVMMEHLLSQRKEAHERLTIQQVKALLLDMVVGSGHVTSSTVELAMAHLLRDPRVMRKAKEEIDAVVGRDGGAVVEESHLPELHYLEAVIKEVLRLHPVAPLLIPHRTGATCTVAGYRIPEGTKVFVNVWAIHRDPEFWGQNATEFKPERFQSGGITANKLDDRTGMDFHYLPFGAGERMCPGANLGRKLVMLMVASLLHAADWTLPDGVAQVDLSEKFGIVIELKKPLVAVPTLIR